MKALCQCTYCGHQWIQAFYSKPEEVPCPKPRCGHREAKLSELATTDVFGYANDEQCRLERIALEQRRKRQRK